MHCLPTFNLSDCCQPNAHVRANVYLDVCVHMSVYARVCMLVGFQNQVFFVFVFTLYCFFVVVCLKKKKRSSDEFGNNR